MTDRIRGRRWGAERRTFPEPHPFPFSLIYFAPSTLANALRDFAGSRLGLSDCSARVCWTCSPPTGLSLDSGSLRGKSATWLRVPLCTFSIPATFPAPSFVFFFFPPVGVSCLWLDIIHPPGLSGRRAWRLFAGRVHWPPFSHRRQARKCHSRAPQSGQSGQCSLSSLCSRREAPGGPTPGGMEVTPDSCALSVGGIVRLIWGACETADV